MASASESFARLPTHQLQLKWKFSKWKKEEVKRTEDDEDEQAQLMKGEMKWIKVLPHDMLVGFKSTTTTLVCIIKASISFLPFAQAKQFSADYHHDNWRLRSTFIVATHNTNKYQPS